MSSPYLAEIRIFSFNFAPKGWALCNGQTLPINQNQALFSLVGTSYGGNGVTSFGLPNLQGRTAMGFSNTFPQGSAAGEETHTLTMAEMPAHTHVVLADADPANATSSVPTAGFPGSVAPTALYAQATASTTMAATMVSTFGGGAAHENRQPFLVLNFCIALQGIFPSRN